MRSDRRKRTGTYKTLPLLACIALLCPLPLITGGTGRAAAAGRSAEAGSAEDPADTGRAESVKTNSAEESVETEMDSYDSGILIYSLHEELPTVSLKDILEKHGGEKGLDTSGKDLDGKVFFADGSGSIQYDTGDGKTILGIEGSLSDVSALTDGQAFCEFMKQRELFHIPEDARFALGEKEEQSDGRTRYSYIQMAGSAMVEDGRMTAYFSQDGLLCSVSGNYVDDIPDSMSVEPGLTSEEVLTGNHVQKDAESRLMVVQDGQGGYILVYRVLLPDQSAAYYSAKDGALIQKVQTVYTISPVG